MCFLGNNRNVDDRIILGTTDSSRCAYGQRLINVFPVSLEHTNNLIKVAYCYLFVHLYNIFQLQIYFTIPSGNRGKLYTHIHACTHT